MFKQILLLAGAALLFAGTAQADAPAVQPTTIAKSAFVFSATNMEIEAARNCDATSTQDRNQATEERDAEARPVYPNGGN